MDKNKKVALTEGLLFVSGDEGVTYDDFKALLKVKKDSEVDELVKILKDKYTKDKACGLDIQKFAGTKFRMITKKDDSQYYLELENIKTEARLSFASLETLSIIAYKGPISRPEIENIRGVNSEGIIHKLRVRNLIRESGRSEGPGRPVLFIVTDDFMKYFSINSLDELPPLPENDNSNEDKNIFARKDS